MPRSRARPGTNLIRGQVQVLEPVAGPHGASGAGVRGSRKAGRREVFDGFPSGASEETPRRTDVMVSGVLNQ